MRIIALTAGAAGMYCGTCLRDNAIAAELSRQGHDVILQPIYTPTLTDEENVSEHRVLFGGISVYLQQHVPLFRYTPSFLDRIWDSEWALRAATRRSIAVDPKLLGEMTVAMLEGEDGPLRKEFRKLVDWLKQLPEPDVVALPYSLLSGMAEPMRNALGRPIVCTLQGEDLFLSGLIEPFRSRSLALIRKHHESIDAYTAVSDYYAGFMCQYLAIPGERMHVAPIGISLEGHRLPARQPRPERHIGYFGRIAPEKGLHVLADAYLMARQGNLIGPARLDAGGYLAPEKTNYLSGIEGRFKRAGLEGEFRYHGAPDRDGKIRFLQSLDVFSLPATYDEPKGLSVLEAMANGVSVVLPRRGSFPEMIARTGGGVLVEPDNPEALAQALAELCTNHGLRDSLGRHGALGVAQHYSIAVAARRTAEIYEQVVARRSVASGVA